MSKDPSSPIPRYLYRVYAKDNNGDNSPDKIVSAAVAHGGRSKLMEIPNAEVKAMLETHFQWKNTLPRDEFISWTSSLLYALQYAVRKTIYRSLEDDIMICVLDTHRLQDLEGVEVVKEEEAKPHYSASRNDYQAPGQPTIIINNNGPQIKTEYVAPLACGLHRFTSACDLIGLYGIPATDKLRYEYHTTEYLAHGVLHIGHNEASSTVSLASLRRKGLFELIPELDDKYSKRWLYLRVDSLRKAMVSRVSTTSLPEVVLATRISSLFSSGDRGERTKLVVVMMMALLGLRKRDPDDSAFVAFLSCLKGT